MRDTVELNPAGVYLLERLFSRQERAKLFRSWAGAASMWLKVPLLRSLSHPRDEQCIQGGNDVWGDHDGAPDDPDDATTSSGAPSPVDLLGLCPLSVHRPNLPLPASSRHQLWRLTGQFDDGRSNDVHP